MYAVLLQRALRCRTAECGLAALSAIDEFRPDVAILDIGRANFDGYEVAKRVRSDPRNGNLQLIALTGYGRSADRAANDEAGFDAHVVKPVDTARLLDLLGT